MLNGKNLDDLDNIQEDIQENSDLMSQFETRFAEIGKMSTDFDSLDFDEEELMKELDELDPETKDTTEISNIQQDTKTYSPQPFTMNDSNPLDSSSLLDDIPVQKDTLIPLFS